MGETLTGTDSMSLETMALIAGAVVVCLALIIWFVKRRGHMIFMRGGGNRQPRLAVLDAAAVDSRRRLVLVRRDHVEHLILIGGPSDIVVESGIGRSAAAAQAEKAKQAAKAAAKAAAKSNQEKRSADDQAAQPAKASAAATVEQSRPPANQVAEKKPAETPVSMTAKAKPESSNDSAPKPAEPPAPQLKESAAVTSSPVEAVVAATSVAAVAVTSSREAVVGEKDPSTGDEPATAKSSEGETASSSVAGAEPAKTQTIKNEFEDALDAARDLVMPENAGEPAQETASNTQANYAHAVPAPESIDPVPAPPPPAAAPTTVAPAQTGPIAAAADDLIADFDRVLEAEMGRTDAKKVVEFEQAQKQPTKPEESAEKHDVASLEDEMKKLLGDLSVKQ